MSRTELQLRVATRRSALAMTQTELAVAALRDAALAADVDIDIRITPIRTKGDRVTDVPFEAIGPKGVFAHELQQALLNGEADVAVHSLKDLPASDPVGLVLAAVLEREDARDVVVCARGGLDELPSGARVGTSSARRRALLGIHHPHLEAVGLRGNVDTRLRKVMDEEVEAAVLAAAGLIRLGRADAITQWLDPETFVPPPGQGAVALEVRADSFAADLAWMRHADHPPTRRAVEAERIFMQAMEGGCEVPLGAWATVAGTELRCLGFLSTPDGRLHATASVSGSDPESVGRDLAGRLRDPGAEILAEAATSRPPKTGGVGHSPWG